MASINGDLKVGDKVMLSPNTKWKKGKYNPIDILGTVKNVSKTCIIVLWDNNIKNEYYSKDSDLILQKTTKQMITTTPRLQTNFLNNFKSMLGATRNIVATMKNEVTTKEVKAKLRAKYTNIYIDQAMVSKACEQLFNEGQFIAFRDTGNYRVYSKGVLAAPTVKQAVKMTSKSKFTNINQAIVAHPELADILADYLHKSETKDEYCLLKDMNIIHLNNKVRLETANWDTKTPFSKFAGCNKYMVELNRRSNCN